MGGATPQWTWLLVLGGVALLPVAASLTQLVAVLHRAVISGLICTSETRELRRQVETLRESRSAVLDAEAGELRRIERDLHDGAQQRLVMLTIDLGLGERAHRHRPGSREGAGPRGPRRGAAGAGRAAQPRPRHRAGHPARPWIGPAIESISARGAVPTSVQSDLPAGDRLPDAVERAAYFVVAEALVNVAKHSGRPAARCAAGARVGPGGRGLGRRRRWRDDWLAGGLTGLAGRVEGVDGTFTVSSPAGGPTLVRAAMPVPAWRDAGTEITTPGT